MSKTYRKGHSPDIMRKGGPFADKRERQAFKDFLRDLEEEGEEYMDDEEFNTLYPEIQDGD